MVDSFEGVLRCHYYSLYRYIGWFFSDPSESAKLLEEILRELGKEWDVKSMQGNPVTFIYKHTRRRIWRELESKGKGNPTGMEAENWARRHMWEDSSQIPASQPASASHRVREASRSFTPTDLEVYGMRDVGGISESIVADVMEWPRENVRKSLHDQRDLLVKKAMVNARGSGNGK